MFKPMHGLQATLLTALGTGNTVAQLDSNSIAMLKARLGTGNHTYVLIKNAAAYEIAKITAVYADSVTLVRGQDGTTAKVFALGSSVEFVLGEAAIQDIIEEKMLSEVHITGSGIADVQKVGLNTYIINVPTINITSESPDILVSGEYPEFVISAPIKSDCCG